MQKKKKKKKKKREGERDGLGESESEIEEEVKGESLALTALGLGPAGQIRKLWVTTPLGSVQSSPRGLACPSLRVPHPGTLRVWMSHEP